MLKKIALAGLLAVATLLVSTAGYSRTSAPPGETATPKSPLGHGLCPSQHC